MVYFIKDALFNMDLKRLEELWKSCPKYSPEKKPLQTIVCSATLSNILVQNFTVFL